MAREVHARKSHVGRPALRPPHDESVYLWRRGEGTPPYARISVSRRAVEDAGPYTRIPKGDVYHVSYSTERTNLHA